MKYISRIIIIITIFLFGFYFGQNIEKYNNKKSFSNNKNDLINVVEKDIHSANLLIVYNDGKIKTFKNIIFNDGETVFDLLKNITEKENIQIDYKDYGESMGVMINSIDDVNNNFNKGFYWQYWINDEYAKEGASFQKLQNNDLIIWKYTNGQF